MSKYKLSAEEIRKRASAIIHRDAKAKESIEQVIKLLEDATGEKVSAPFDESKICLGAVWRYYPIEGGNILIIGKTAGSSGFRVIYEDGVTSGELTVGDLKKNFDGRAEYLGQYNFAAGLPAA